VNFLRKSVDGISLLTTSSNCRSRVVVEFRVVQVDAQDLLAVLATKSIDPFQDASSLKIYHLNILLKWKMNVKSLLQKWKREYQLAKWEDVKNNVVEAASQWTDEQEAKFIDLQNRSELREEDTALGREEADACRFLRLPSTLDTSIQSQIEERDCQSTNQQCRSLVNHHGSH